MTSITTTVLTDERTWQGEFYKNLFGEDSDEITIDRSTDGYTKGILFEHKTNVQSYGESKALSQALIYLTRFNRDGLPVPAKICLVGQEEQRCYIYDTEKYLDIINDIPTYANMKASDGIIGFHAGARAKLINFDMTNPARGMRDILDFVQEIPQTVQVTITEHNVYGWANYYYDHASEYKQKPEKKKFFEELRNPSGTLKQYIKPWTGQETDFRYIMDMLNDPMTQKKLGAFYTPPAYAKKAVELVKQAIARVPQGNDYVIIDRCAGTGNLEMYLDNGNEDILSHVIVSTYELKEWMVLKDRYHGRVRYIIPPVPANPSDLPDLNDDGFLSGANALTRDIIDNAEVRKYLDNDKCTVILFENPPYVEIKEGGEHNQTTDAFMKQGMKADGCGKAVNDIANIFIWSAFKYFLRQPTDSYVVFSPIKYWKAQKLVAKKMLNGFAFNRVHFHAKTQALISVILWSNEDDRMSNRFELQAFDLDEKRNLVDEGVVTVRQINSLLSDKYYDLRSFDNDTEDGIVCDDNGTEFDSEKTSYQKNIYNNNIVGYLTAETSGFDLPRRTSKLVRCGNYCAHGFYLRKDNFLEKLPLLATGKYTDHNNNWKIMSMVMKSGDKAEQYHADVASGQLDKFLCQTLIWTGLTHYAHMRSLNGSDGRFYRNELCFDNLDGKTTLASEKLNEFIANGYELSDEEKALFAKRNDILTYIEQNCQDEYKPLYTYGLYQIDEEINVKIQQGVKADGTPKMIQKYGDLNNLIKDMKTMVKDYYLNNLVDTLFEYEFLK